MPQRSFTSPRLDEADVRILMLSKACYVAAYRRKLEEVAAHPGVELALVVPQSWGTGPTAALLEPGFDCGYRMIVSQPVFSGNHHLHWYPELSRIIREVRPDLLHIDEEPYDFVTAHALAVARRACVRSLFFTWQNLDRRFPPPFGWLERHVLAHVDGAIAGNEEAARILRQRGFRKPLAVLPQFGVDPDVFRPSGGGRNHPPVIFAAARLVPEKGLTTLIEALGGLPGDWQFEIAGSGPQRAELERLAVSLGIRDRVRFLRSVPSTEMPQLLRRVSIVVLPSRTTRRWKEQFGRVLVEAMASQAAVIGSSSGEIPNVIGDAGLVFPEGDVDALRAALALLLHQPDVRCHLGRRGRQRVLAHFTQRRIAEETVAFYARLLV